MKKKVSARDFFLYTHPPSATRIRGLTHKKNEMMHAPTIVLLLNKNIGKIALFPLLSSHPTNAINSTPNTHSSAITLLSLHGFEMPPS